MPKSIPGVMREFKNRTLHSGSSTGKVVTNPKQAIAIAINEQKQRTPTRQLHPAMVRHGRLVAEAHQHLHATVPEYRQASPRQRMLMTQEHVRTRKANGY